MTNYSINKKHFKQKNIQTSAWCIDEFISYLARNGNEGAWSTRILPEIKKIVEYTLLTASMQIESKKGQFEVYGFDIILEDDLKPWLLEVNLSPACSERTEWLTRMLNGMAEQLFQIVLGPALYQIDPSE